MGTTSYDECAKPDVESELQALVNEVTSTIETLKQSKYDSVKRILMEGLEYSEDAIRPYVKNDGTFEQLLEKERINYVHGGHPEAINQYDPLFHLEMALILVQLDVNHESSLTMRKKIDETRKELYRLRATAHRTKRVKLAL